jgi:peptidyl-prolyl cis-trans isomerase SurA
MAETSEPPTERRKKRLEALVRIEDKVEEAAEAAADAAAHAVEATKAAEAAHLARTAKKAKAATATKAAKAAKTAKSKAGKAARTAKAASKAAVPDPSQLMEPTGALQNPTHVLDVRLTDDELAQIERLAAQQELPVPELARSLLVRALNRSVKPQ